MIRNKRMKIPEESKNVKADFYASIHNRFDIEVIDSKTGKVKQKAKAENVMCKAFWDFVFVNTNLIEYKSWFTNICFGDGAGSPSSADTALFSYVGYVAVNSKVDWGQNMSEHYFHCKKSITLTETQYVGKNITEVGIGKGSYPLYTHAMLQDMNGNPISIMKTDTDIITIYATVFLHYPSEYDSINNSIQMFYTRSNSFFVWLVGTSSSTSSNSGYYKGCFGIYPTKNRLLLSDVTPSSTPSSLFDGGSSLVANAENKTFEATCTRIPVGDCNIGGIRYIFLFICYHNTSFGSNTKYTYPWLAIKVKDDWFNQNQINGEALGTGDGSTVDFKTSFDFPYNARVFVDGVEDTTAIVENIGCNYTSGYNQYLDTILISNGNIYPYSQGSNGFYTYENSNYENGISYFYIYKSQWESGTVIECSNDGVTWESIQRTTSGDYYRYVPTEMQSHYKYWRSNESLTSYPFQCELKSSKNVHFTTPPPVGSVITIDYKTETIPKNSNNVFDMKVTIHLGDYVV